MMRSSKRGSQLVRTGVTFAFICVLFVWSAAQPLGAEEQSVRFPHEPLTFVDAEDHVVSSADFPGKWLLIYFGYTHCADLCPTGLSVMVSAFEQIGPAADHVQPLFITVDPERDKGPVLRDFAQAFDQRLIGLSGTVDQIRKAADALGVSFQKVAQGDANYVVDHSSSYALVDPSRAKAVVVRVAEPHLLAAKMIEVLTRAGTPLDKVNNVGAYR
jgi:cytochrome oxidase Cu insertion factor (SCO1/SenC/PrrC family)